MSGLIAYCRQGFEPELAAELRTAPYYSESPVIYTHSVIMASYFCGAIPFMSIHCYSNCTGAA